MISEIFIVLVLRLVRKTYIISCQMNIEIGQIFEYQGQIYGLLTRYDYRNI